MVEKLLIVEDSPMVGKVVMHLAKQELDLELHWVKTFAEAKAAIDQHGHSIFAALVDLNLPDAPNGEVVDFTLKQKIPTIVLTGNFNEQTREGLLKKGIVDYVNKEGRYSYQYAVRMVARLQRNQDIKVMVVEDSSSTRKYIARLLKAYQFQVLEAVDGRDAVKVLLGNPDVRLLITDYNMPNMDGFELVKNLRHKYEKFDLVIIGLSAEGEGGLSAKFIKTGANDFLSKPFNPEEFHCRINHNIESLELVEQIKDSSNRDFLTNLYSRRFFFQEGDQLRQAATDDGKPMALAILNLDDFKALNETYGNLRADFVLKEVAAILNKSLFRFLVARASGKEFYIYMKGLSNEKAVVLMDKVRAIIAKETFVYGEDHLHVTCSIGVSNTLGECLQDQIKHAEKYLIRAKEAGKNFVIGEDDDEFEEDDGYDTQTSSHSTIPSQPFN